MKKRHLKTLNIFRKKSRWQGHSSLRLRSKVSFFLAMLILHIAYFTYLVTIYLLLLTTIYKLIAIFKNLFKSYLWTL